MSLIGDVIEYVGTYRGVSNKRRARFVARSGAETPCVNIPILREPPYCSNRGRLDY